MPGTKVQKYKLTVYLKSGALLNFVCEKYRFGQTNGEFTSYTINGFPDGFDFSVDPGEIAAFTAQAL